MIECEKLIDFLHLLTADQAHLAFVAGDGMHLKLAAFRAEHANCYGTVRGQLAVLIYGSVVNFDRVRGRYPNEKPVLCVHDIDMAVPAQTSVVDLGSGPIDVSVAI